MNIVESMKAIITDLDRTLLCSDTSISDYTLDILKQCHARGIRIMAATARPERSIRDYCRQVSFDALTVLNGAQILLPGKTLDKGISYESGKQILERICAIQDIMISVEMEKGLFANQDIPAWRSMLYPCFPELPDGGTLYKILVSSPAAEIQQRIAEALTDDTYCTAANGALYQIMSRNATKWNGVRAMLEEAGISPKDAVYFGDDQDDIESIKNCGIGVAVANAIPAVREAADWVTMGNDEDGPAHFIEEYILRGSQ